MDRYENRASANNRRPRRPRRRRRQKITFPLLLTALLTVGCLWKLTSELADLWKSRHFLNALASQSVQDNTQTEAPGPAEPEEEEPMEFAPITVDFAELGLYYPDITAWLYCEGTSFNYPVVQTDNNQYYMHRLPDGSESAGGSLFVDCTNAWNFADANTVIYGHDMKDGTMFGYLHNFDSQEYYGNHPVFYLLTPAANYRMDIICAGVVSSDSWIYQKKMDGQVLQNWLDGVSQVSLIRPAVEIPEDAEHFLTLSTCSYEFEGARFVVIGMLTQIR